MHTPVIVKTKRTAIAKAGGALSDVRPEHLAAPVLQSLLTDTGIEAKQIDEVVLGNAVGPGGNLARLALLTAGFPLEIPGVTIDRQCGSGLEAIVYAARFIQSGAGSIYIAGGVESESFAPLKVEKPTSDHAEPLEFTRARFAPDGIGDPDMGIAAENVARTFGITREMQDDFAWRSHQLASIAQAKGHFSNEIVPVERTNGTIFHQDECIRGNDMKKLLARLKPVFEQQGTVTAGNCCPKNDGAAATLIMSKEEAQCYGLKPEAIFLDAVTAGVDPNLLGIGPVPAIRKLLIKNRLTMNEIDLVEFNEAFASQVIASLHLLDIPLEKVNISGGAIAFGHPYGASGSIVVTRLIENMKQTNAQYGIATMGIGGGLGTAVLLRRDPEE
ncbi:acetyl-CoA C-acyltransferase [Geomicrobium sediminis]|uniref:Acetyl-CoA C-acetyltransferase n=1 Tax=Geomicrobium sediminis TaxID=1347788 RepID=A0ABS2PFU5_9BACL|nr:acetyl-CoA C-acetyltransferase [Geomicrobium sediminis]